MTRRLSRRRLLVRCARCRLHVPLCLCGSWPRIASRTRVVLVPHFKDWRQTSNTGRVAVMTLRHAELAVWGRRDAALDPALLLRPDHRHLLLHPGDDAPPLEPADDGRPVRLLVPDGTWRQSAHIAKRLDRLPGVERVRLDLAPKAGLRRAPSPSRVGTGEAIAAALDRLGEPAAGAELRDAVRTMVDRTLWVRGKLPAERVHGGLPLPVRRAMSGLPNP